MCRAGARALPGRRCLHVEAELVWVSPTRRVSLRRAAGGYRDLARDRPQRRRDLGGEGCTRRRCMSVRTVSPRTQFTAGRPRWRWRRWHERGPRQVAAPQGRDPAPRSGAGRSPLSRGPGCERAAISRYGPGRHCGHRHARRTGRYSERPREDRGRATGATRSQVTWGL
jgi:hypothetical protein